MNKHYFSLLMILVIASIFAFFSHYLGQNPFLMKAVSYDNFLIRLMILSCRSLPLIWLVGRSRQLALDHQRLIRSASRWRYWAKNYLTLELGFVLTLILVLNRQLASSLGVILVYLILASCFCLLELAYSSELALLVVMSWLVLGVVADFGRASLLVLEMRKVYWTILVMLVCLGNGLVIGFASRKDYDDKD